MRDRVRDTVAAVRVELAHDRAYLLPLRIFIGLGWLRAAAAKATDPAWYDGAELTIFLNGQLGWSQEAFPFYGTLMEAVFLPNAALLGIVVIVLQLFAGMAIVAGYYTNAALLVGLVLNVSFILAGRPDPSAFYIVIQLVLFLGGAGAVLGMDASRWRHHRHPLLVSSIGPVAADAAHERHVYAVLAGVSVVLAAAMVPYVSSLDPATVVEDPAMVLVTLALFAAAAATIRAVGGSQANAATPAAVAQPVA
jgi:thiosulfate dehydrogenase (quinone) large subunit